MLAADYIDKKACPVCGKPARRIGNWYVRHGEWEFQAEKVAVRGPRSERPDKGDGWENFPRTVDVTDQRTGLVSGKRRDEWFLIHDYECIGGRHDDGECHGTFNRNDCHIYHGPEESWMAAPEPPGFRGDEFTKAVDATRGKMAAANDRDVA